MHIVCTTYAQLMHQFSGLAAKVNVLTGGARRSAMQLQATAPGGGIADVPHTLPTDQASERSSGGRGRLLALVTSTPS